MMWLRDALTRDAGLKLVSLVIAAGIWARVSLYGGDEVEQVYVRPIALSNVEPGLSAAPATPGALAQITVVGPRRAHLLLARRLRPYVDLKNIKSPLGAVTLKVETNAGVEAAVKVLVSPATLEVIVRPAAVSGT